jgi:hypothetical protein
MKAWRHLSTCDKTKGYKTLRHECERHEAWDLENNDNAMVEMGKKIKITLASQAKCPKPWAKIPKCYWSKWYYPKKWHCSTC